MSWVGDGWLCSQHLARALLNAGQRSELCTVHRMEARHTTPTLGSMDRTTLLPRRRRSDPTMPLGKLKKLVHGVRTLEEWEKFIRPKPNQYRGFGEEIIAILRHGRGGRMEKFTRLSDEIRYYFNDGKTCKFRPDEDRIYLGANYCDTHHTDHAPRAWVRRLMGKGHPLLPRRCR